MRIIAGSLKRRTLSIPRSLPVRPTTDRVREAVFSWLLSRTDLEGAEVLDIFAGSGALGFEAISRGASRAILVEKASRVADLIRTNADRLGISDQVSVVTADAPTWLGRSGLRAFDVVFADPPYDYLDILKLPDWALPRVAPGGVFVLEHSNRGQFDDHPNLVDERRYGKSTVAYFRHREENHEGEA